MRRVADAAVGAVGHFFLRNQDNELSLQWHELLIAEECTRTEAGAIDDDALFQPGDLSWRIELAYDDASAAGDDVVHEIPTSPGDIVTETGTVIGRHRGLAFYTLGQRGGLEIGGRSGHDEQPWYVAAKDLARNELLAVQGHDHPLLVSRALATGPCNWLVQPEAAEFDSRIKVRYRQSDQDCQASLGANGALRVRFAEPQRAVTPGQFAVLYEGERCLGGGVIELTMPHHA